MPTTTKQHLEQAAPCVDELAKLSEPDFSEKAIITFKAAQDKMADDVDQLKTGLAAAQEAIEALQTAVEELQGE